jgi:carbonic anhydrase
MTESISVSQGQVDAFASMYPMNARPVQALHGRVIE